MQQTSALYKELLAGDYTVETRVAIGESGLLVEKTGDHITFGGTRILIATSGADGGYGANMLSSVETSGGLFDGDEPSCGNCISREVNIKMLKPIGQIPGLSRVGIYARITDGTRASEWLLKAFSSSIRLKKMQKTMMLDGFASTDTMHFCFLNKITRQTQI